MSSKSNGSVTSTEYATSRTKLAENGQRPQFVPAQTFQGSRAGYVFRTSREHGTGYHLDVPLVADAPSPKRKRARFDMSQNETKLIPPAQKLLQEAEASVDPHTKVLDLTPRGVQNATKALHKATQTNSMQRAKFADDPSEYMDSELALHEHIQALNGLAAGASELYPLLLQQEDLWTDLAQLLSHENTDVSLTVIKVLVEWLDPSLIETTESVSDLGKQAAETCVDLVVANLGRIDSEDDNQRSDAVEDVLTMMENLLDLATDETIVSSIAKTPLVAWLVEQIMSSESDFADRSTELLALLWQQPSLWENETWKDVTRIPRYTSSLVETPEPIPNKKGDNDGSLATTTDAMEVILQAVAKFRKKQPSSETQVDYLENLCTALASALTFAGKPLADAFLEAQGVELVLRCLRERVHAGGTTLVWLDMRGHDRAAQHLLKAGAFKVLFPLWMQTNLPKVATFDTKRNRAQQREWKRKIEETVIHIFYNWSRFLSDETEDGKTRFLVKFRDRDFEKCDRLVELLLKYDEKARKAEYKYYRDSVDDEDDTEAALEAKLQGGGELFHRLGALSAFLCAHSKSCHEHILQQLEMQQSGIGVIRAAVEEFANLLPADSSQRKELLLYLTKI